MLSGSAFLRVIVLLAAAAVLAGVAQHYLSRSDAPEPPRAEATRPSPSARAEPRTVPTAPQPAPAPARPEPAAPPETALAVPAPAAPREAAPVTPPREPAPDQALAQPPDGDAPLAGETAAPDTEATETPAGDLVDLNTGTVAQLNGLKGGGAIGRAIIQRRPYSSVDQLLSKRVLSRSTFQRIKDQVTVR